MINIRSAASVAAIVFALAATPVMAANCAKEVRDTVASLGIKPGDVKSIYATVPPADYQKASDGFVQEYGQRISAACRGKASEELMKMGGVQISKPMPSQSDTSAPESKSTPSSAPTPKPVATSAPAPVATAVSSAPSGGGKMVDDKIAELERKLQSGNLDAESVRAIRAEMASLKSQFEQLKASRSEVVRRTTALQKVFVQGGLSAAERELLNGAQAKIDAIDSKIAEAVSTANKQLDARLSEVEQVNRGHSAHLKAHDDHLSALDQAVAALKNQSAPAQWPLWLAFLVLAGGLGWLWYSKATKKEVQAEFVRVEREFEAVDDNISIDPASLEAARQMMAGVVSISVLSNGQPIATIPFNKGEGDTVTPKEKIGDIQPGTPIALRHLQSKIRRVYRRVPGCLSSYRVGG